MFICTYKINWPHQCTFFKICTEKKYRHMIYLFLSSFKHSDTACIAYNFLMLQKPQNKIIRFSQPNLQAPLNSICVAPPSLPKRGSALSRVEFNRARQKSPPTGRPLHPPSVRNSHRSEVQFPEFPFHLLCRGHYQGMLLDLSPREVAIFGRCIILQSVGISLAGC